MYHDDVLDALAFAYVCRLTYNHRQVEEINNDKKEISKPKMRLVRGKNGLLTMEYTRV